MAVTKGGVRPAPPLEDADAEAVWEMAEGGRGAMALARGKAVGLSSPLLRLDAGLGAEDSAFIAKDRPGAAIVRAGTPGLGLAALAGREAGTAPVLTLAGPGVAADALDAGADVGAAEGADGPDPRALLIRGTIVALDAGLSFDVWSMT